MSKKIKMITFDLDDTLWDNRPTILKAEIDTRNWIEDKVGKKANVYLSRMRSKGLPKKRYNGGSE